MFALPFPAYSESAAIYVCKYLLEEGAQLSIYDPKVKEEQMRRDLSSVVSDDKGESGDIRQWTVDSGQ